MGIGAISYTHTSPIGEVVGCGGECGVCCAMGAAAIVEMYGGDGYQIENGAKRNSKRADKNRDIIFFQVRGHCACVFSLFW